jgi:anti-sigma regulatory factor (Ser/Thr protein kinase)
MANRLGFNETERGEVALVVTEAGTNLVKHALGGMMLLRPLGEGSGVGIEVLALDRGPGMADVASCFRDGFSTAGSPGSGLGAIARLAASTDVYSLRPTGTALVARLWSGPPPILQARHLDVAAVTVPKTGETVCGDAWAIAQAPRHQLLLVADGLGHGPLAAEAASNAVRVFREHVHAGPVAILRAVHQALHSTRGAVVAVAEVDLDARVVRYAGAGNIAGTILAGEASQSLMSHNGTVGHEVRKFQEVTCPFPPGALLILHSDGLGSRWTLAPYPGLASRSPALIAGVLYRDFQRGRDDVTVVVAREEGASP